MNFFKLKTNCFSLSPSRDIYIDALKGFTILTVVVHHAIQRNDINYLSSIVFNAINTFHMPLFMFLSGFLLFGRIDKNKIDWMTKKFKLLIIPFFAWTIIHYFWFTNVIEDSFFSRSGAQSLSEYILMVFKDPKYGLWFLLTLFFIFVTVAILDKLIKHYNDFIVLIPIIVFYAIPFFNNTIFGLYLIKYYYVFFAAGYLFAGHKNDIKIKGQGIIITAISLICFILFLIYDPLLNHLTIPYAGVIYLALRYIAAFSGIALSFNIFTVLKNTVIAKTIARTGPYTLDIYVTHAMFLKLGFGSPVLAVVITILLTLIIITAVRQSNLVSQLLYGRKIKIVS